MYYVAKVYKHMLPSIVESFENEEHADVFAKVITASKGTPYVVLKELPIVLEQKHAQHILHALNYI